MKSGRKTVLVTGSSGFIGRSLVARLAAGAHVRAAVRSLSSQTTFPEGVEAVATGDLALVEDWAALLDGVDFVVHLAGRAHAGTGPEEERKREFDVKTAQNLASASAKHGVQRFVFLSSIKAMAERSPSAQALNEASDCRPSTPYGRTKLAAEKAVIEACGTRMPSVIFRPPLVYGPGMKANMDLLFRAVARGFPLPLGGIDNKRSFLFVENLTSAIEAALTAPLSSHRTFLIRDGEDLATPDLLRRIARALGRPSRLWPMPAAALRAAAAIFGVSDSLSRLVDSLHLDDSALRAETGWKPPYTVDGALEITGRGYVAP